MSHSGRYLLTGVLAIMLVIAPLRAVMALPLDSGDPCASMSEQGHDMQRQAPASTTPDENQSDQTHGHGCCNDRDSTCTTDCQTCMTLSYAPIAASSVKTPRQNFLKNGYKAGVVPVRSHTPLLRPPATLHS